jgi:hypothetical protein
VLRPITFDEERARQQTDVVYAHLGHPLIQRAARELRGKVWSRDTLHGVSAVVVDGLDQSLAAAVVRLVLVGEGGTRLHEEVFLAGTRISRNQEIGIDRAEELLTTTLDGARLSAPGEATRRRLMSHWNTDAGHPGGIGARVAEAVSKRAERRLGQVDTDLAERRTADLASVDQIFDRFRATLQGTLDAAEQARRAGEDMLFQLAEEQQQREKDLARIRTRLSTLDDEQRAERESIERRYRDVRAHTFVAALVFALTPADVEKLEAAVG